jgi:hypothetical protein
MLHQQQNTKLTEGTTLILLKEICSSNEFNTHLDSLGMLYIDAKSKMERALKENSVRFYPPNKIVRPKLTLNRDIT